MTPWLIEEAPDLQLKRCKQMTELMLLIAFC